MRPSGDCAFGLAVARSPGFGSEGPDFYPLAAPTDLRLARPNNLLAHYAKGTLWPMPQLLTRIPGFTHVLCGLRSLTVLYATGPRGSSLGGCAPTFSRRTAYCSTGGRHPPPSPGTC